MSQQAVLAFREKVGGSPELQQQIRAGTAAKTLDLVALGQSHGCQFTADEVSAFLSSAELSDLELELVAGGGLTRPTGAYSGVLATHHSPGKH